MSAKFPRGGSKPILSHPSTWPTLLTSMLKFVSNVRQLFAADDIFRFIFLGVLRVKHEIGIKIYLKPKVTLHF